jgi:hypothetical protein
MFPRNTKADMCQADRSLSEESSQTGEGEQPVEDDRPSCTQIDIT